MAIIKRVITIPVIVDISIAEDQLGCLPKAIKKWKAIKLWEDQPSVYKDNSEQAIIISMRGFGRAPEKIHSICKNKKV